MSDTEPHDGTAELAKIVGTAIAGSGGDAMAMFSVAVKALSSDQVAARFGAVVATAVLDALRTGAARKDGDG